MPRFGFDSLSLFSLWLFLCFARRKISLIIHCCISSVLYCTSVFGLITHKIMWIMCFSLRQRTYNVSILTFCDKIHFILCLIVQNCLAEIKSTFYHDKFRAVYFLKFDFIVDSHPFFSHHILSYWNRMSSTFKFLKNT